MPRTEDYERAFVAMLGHPLLMRGREGSVVPFDHVTNALSRLERYRELPEPLVAAMVVDGEFQRRLNAARDEVAERAAIELSVQRLATEAHERAERIQVGLSGALSRIEQLDASVETLRAAKKSSDEKAEQASTSLVQVGDKHRDALVAIVAMTEGIVAEVESRSVDQLKSLRSEFDQKLRWIGYASSVRLASIAATAKLIVLPFTWMLASVVGGWWVTAVIGMLLLPLWGRRGGVVVVLGLVLALLGSLGLTYQLLENDDSREEQPEGPKSPPPEQSG